uniref:PiggyBac transposable element-derived protein domain-containing protein n=1 Tax=Clastoptera arizonana TaxID=38151 RepID=A0A1B6BXZ9_9HEMI
MLMNYLNLTIVGTLRKNKKEIPPEFINTRIRPEKTSMFAYKDGGTLLTYCPKKNKVVLLISTMHHTDETNPNSGDAQKPHILTFYNSRTSTRWPLTAFYRLLNVIGLNCFIIFKHKKGDFQSVRKEFLKNIARATTI